ncbi:hypothetical protein SAMN06265795_102522 [Noviherbaspirillum humi]|uniref:Uncharacterized protein n=1 Tax=Noviherbaspirillum humi TaxID=1688639 RepID=A0A239E404_9BURK|nr:hypothetical protein [Noviherbaspirillum humi]SNS39480.1 hypothetical protein SAMN06265795_102522 [Noviherbaspirillum humi]
MNDITTDKEKTMRLPLIAGIVVVYVVLAAAWIASLPSPALSRVGPPF